MKRLLASISLLALTAFAMSGCASTTPPTSAQLIQVCTNTQTTIAGLQSLQGLPASAMEDLTTAEPIVTAMCAIPGSINTANLQTLIGTVFPALLRVVNTSVTDTTKHDEYVTAILAAQIIVGNMTVGMQ